MKNLIILLSLVAGPAFAQCPDPTLDGPQEVATGAQLLAPQTWDVAAAGTLSSPCDAWQQSGVLREELVGFLPSAPTTIFELTGMAPHIMTVTARAECGPVLAVQSGDGQWFYGEFTEEGQMTTLWGVPDGPLRVWLGSATPEGCEGDITLETFDR